MKVIFLDVDGVINSNFWLESHQKEISDGTLIDKEKIELVAKIVNKTGAVLVMHSGWRFWFDNTMQPIRKSKMFSKVKASEIFLWLKQNPNIDKWIVLDDIDLHNDELTIRQIRTNAKIGLTEKDADKAIEMLL